MSGACPKKMLISKQLPWNYRNCSHKPELLKLESKTLRSGLATARLVMASLGKSSCCRVSGNPRSEGTCLV